MATIRTAIELEDRLSAVLNNVVNTVGMTISAIERMNGNLDKPIESAYFEGLHDSFAQASADIQNLGEKIQKTLNEPPPPPPVKPVFVPVEYQWQTDNFEVFGGGKVKQFKQQAQAIVQQLNNVNSVQNTISKNAEVAKIFPPKAISDISALQNKIQAMNGYLQKLSKKPHKFVSEMESAKLTQLRSQLENIKASQYELNSAVEAMDVGRANSEYLRLSQTISETESYIRANSAGQEKFNQKLQSGISGSDGLMRSIKRIAAAYLSVQSIGKVLDLSDTMTQTTARLNMIVDDGGSVEALQNKIFASAQASRGSYQSTADAVAKFGLMAGDAFNSNDEIIAFAEQINKQFTIAGTSASGIDAAMLQLTQAMGSGVLRGEELNSVFEQAPTIIKSIADYLDVPIGSIREMAAEGEITAQIVKNAMFAVADETNAKFKSMPMTFSQIWTSFENQALMAFQPVLERLSELANSEEFQIFVENAVNALVIVANTALAIVSRFANMMKNNWGKLEKIIQGVTKAINVMCVMLIPILDIAFLIAEVIIDNWSTIEIIILAVAAAIFVATAAQHGLNAAFSACPIFWIIAAFVVLTTVVDKIARSFDNTSNSIVSSMNDTTAAIDDTASSVDGLGTSVSNLDRKYRNLTSGIAYTCGSIGGIAAYILNILGSVSNFLLDTGMNIYNFFAGIINGAVDIFNDFTGGVARAVCGLADTVMSVLQSIASAVDLIFGSNLSDTWQRYRDDLQKYVDKTYGVGIEVVKKYTEEDLNKWRFKRIDPQDWFNKAAEFGANLNEAFSGNNLNVSGFDYDLDIDKILDEINDNTASISDSLSVTDEELKYLRDIAERETINRFTTAEITIEQTNNNSISSDADLDGIVNGLTDAVTEAVFVVTEGVHA